MPARKKQSTDEKASPPARSRKTTSKKKKDENTQDLVIVESPSKAKTINKYLGSGYKVLASMGHVRDLIKSRRKGDIVSGVNENWEPSYTVDAKKKKVISELKKEVAKSNRIYLATDPDREGEAIAWHLKEVLGLEDDQTYRIAFNEITKTAVQNALAQAGKIDMERVDAQEARRILDRAVGFPLSQLMGKKVKPNSSAGRVQSVALRLVVDREREIEAFEPTEYWKLTALLSIKDSVKLDPKPFTVKLADSKLENTEEDEEEDDKKKKTQPKKKKAGPFGDIPEGTFPAELAEWNGEKIQVGKELFSNEESSRSVAEKLDNAAYTVTKIEQKDRQDKPSAPFTTSTLQQQASTRLRFSASRTMRVAQQLYQGADLGSEGSVGLITYMRTDSTRVSNDALTAVRGHIEQAHGEDYLPTKPNSYSSGKSAQEAHEAIRPTDLSYTPERVADLGLAGDNLRLYTLIFNRFVASQMKPAIFAVTNVEIEAIAPDNQGTGLFKAQGRILKFDGYRKVYSPSKQEDVNLPALEEKQDLDRLDTLVSQHFTQPPPRYTEATLVKALEKEGIGRPSTYAAIMGKITDEKRGYVRVEGRAFHATEIGKTQTDLLVDHFPDIMDLKFTSGMEDNLDEIETGKTNRIELLQQFWSPFSEALEVAKDKMPSKRDQETGEMCPKCGKPLVIKYTRASSEPFIGCSGWSKDEDSCNYMKTMEGQEIINEQILTDHKCPTCGKQMEQRSGRGGDYLMCSDEKCITKMTFDENGEPVLAAQPTEHVCNRCKKPMVLRAGRNGHFLGCTGYPKCRNTMQVDAEGKPIVPEEIGIKCEKCSSAMSIKMGPRGPFFGCTGYPKCRSTKKMTEEDREKYKDKLPAGGQKKAAEKVEVNIECPDCGGDKMFLRTGRGGSQFLGCTKYPKCKGTLKMTEEIQEKLKEDGVVKVGEES